MSPLTIFLAKLLGLYCTIFALAMMTRKQNAVATVKAIVANPPVLFFAEAISLVCGLAMIIGHNIWSGGALPVVVTLVGWLMVIRGAGLLALSPAGAAKLLEVLRYERLFYFYMGGTLVLGLYLTWAGFSDNGRATGLSSLPRQGRPFLWLQWLMTAPGHERRFEHRQVSSALPQSADYFGAEPDFA